MVDPLREYPDTGLPFTHWCHMAADSGFDELHAFAAVLGIPRRAFQRDHYDLPPHGRSRAVAAGAVEVSTRELLARMAGPRGERARRRRPGKRGPYDRDMPDRLYFTDSDEANQLIAQDPLALLIGFALDQQVTVQKAFSGPLAIKERVGTLDAARLAATDLEPVFRERPAVHRFPGSMAKRVQALCAHVAERYDGDAARIWTGASTPEELRRNLEDLPGFGEMKVDSTAAVLARRYGVALAEPLIPGHPTLGDVDSPEALASYQAGKRAHKAALRAAAEASRAPA